MKISQSLLKKSQPSIPLKIFSTLLENVLTLPENFTCNHPENLSKPLNNSQPPGIFLNPPENFTHLENFSTPSIFLNPPSPPQKKSQPLPDIISTLLKKSQRFNPSRKNFNPSQKIATPPNKMSTPPEKCQPGLPKNSQPHSKNSQPHPKNLNPAPKKIANPSRKNVTSTEKF